MQGKTEAFVSQNFKKKKRKKKKKKKRKRESLILVRTEAVASQN